MIYFDNAATSWPKPPATKAEVLTVMERFGANPGRGSYPFAAATAAYMDEARREIAAFLGVTPYEHLIFTGGNTEGANLVLKTVLRPGDHLIYTSQEHNAVRRTALALAKQGVAVTMVRADGDDDAFLNNIRQALRRETKLIAVNHGSNVHGLVLPVAKVASLGREHGVLTFVDMAQTAGVLPLNVTAAGVDFAAYAGHKSLLGYGGIGAVYVRDEQQLAPLLHGGTGSLSYLKDQPKVLPGGFEAGTRNLLGVGSLLGGVRYLKERDLKTIYDHEKDLVMRFLEGVGSMAHIEVYRLTAKPHLPVVSLNVRGISADQVASDLARKGDICVRAGLHCAPDAHAQIGTAGKGTVRFSFGPFNTAAEVDIALNVLATEKRWW